MITADRIQELFHHYLDLVRLEVEEFGIKPTEARHLIGRLGELYCAVEVGGTLASRVNQHGFDVISGDDRRISVKTTAQTTGFVAISKSTASSADDLMVVQYQDGTVRTIYYGPILPALETARFYQPDNNYEFEISKVEALAHTRYLASMKPLLSVEGGSIHTAIRNGKYLVTVDQTAAVDVLDVDDRDGIEPIIEHSFQSLEERDRYIKSRGWPSAV